MQLPLTIGEEIRTLRFVLHAVDDVHGKVEGAWAQSESHARTIAASHPSPSGGYSSSRPYSTALPASTASYNPKGHGTVADILTQAQRELALGVHEQGGNNVAAAYDKNGNLVKRPYDINGPWCRLFHLCVGSGRV